MVKDIFDELEAETASDPFDEVESTEESVLGKFKSELTDLLAKIDDKERKKENNKLTSEIQNFVKTEIAKIKPVQNIIERQIQVVKHEQIPVHLEPKVIKAPPQIIKEIKEVRVEVPKEDNRKLVEEKDLAALTRRIEDLVAELEKVKSFSLMRGGSGVIGIPPPEGNPDNYVLTKVSGKAKWAASTGGGLAAGTFTVSNNTPSYTFDPTADPIDNLYQVVATLIRKLQGEI